MQKIQAVIFDIDGTLADTIPLIIAAFRKAVEPLINRPLPDKEIIDAFGPDEEGSVKAIAPDDYKKGTDDFFKYYAAMHDMCNKPFDGITELLQVLKDKGVHLAIATGKGKYASDMSLNRFKLKPFFEQIENGSPDGSRKVEAIGEILHALNVPKHAAVYVGDSPNDIKESRQAGVGAIGVAWSTKAEKEKLQAAKPDELFFTVKDFSDWIEEHT